MGLTLADSEGKLVAEDSIWQFNFHFDLATELAAGGGDRADGRRCF